MFFSNMKEKKQKAYRIESYDEILTEILMSMFTYDKIPKELKERENFIEETLLYGGAVAIFKLTKKMAMSTNSFVDKFISSKVQFTGMPDVNGIGEDCICTTENGLSIEFKNWRENPDIAIIFNNSTMSPDVNIGRYSDILAEVETSEKLQTIFSRLYPIPIVKNNKVKIAVEQAIKNMLDGKIATILDEDKIAKYIEDATKEAIESVALTEPDKAQYIQYLSKFHDDLMRRFYGLYGMDESGNSKMAQQSVEEVSRNDESSMIIPHDMFKARKKGIEMCNEKFGWEGVVMFTECWQSRDAEINVTDEKTEEENNDGLEENSSDDSDNNNETEKPEVKEEEGEKEDESKRD